MHRFLSSAPRTAFGLRGHVLCSGVETPADGAGDQAALTGRLIMGSIAYFAEGWRAYSPILWPSTFSSPSWRAGAEGETPAIGPRRAIREPFPLVAGTTVRLTMG